MPLLSAERGEAVAVLGPSKGTRRNLFQMTITEWLKLSFFPSRQEPTTANNDEDMLLPPDPETIEYNPVHSNDVVGRDNGSKNSRKPMSHSLSCSSIKLKQSPSSHKHHRFRQQIKKEEEEEEEIEQSLINEYRTRQHHDYSAPHNTQTTAAPPIHTPAPFRVRTPRRLSMSPQPPSCCPAPAQAPRPALSCLRQAMYEHTNQQTIAMDSSRVQKLRYLLPKDSGPELRERPQRPKGNGAALLRTASNCAATVLRRMRLTKPKLRKSSGELKSKKCSSSEDFKQEAEAKFGSLFTKGPDGPRSSAGPAELPPVNAEEMPNKSRPSRLDKLRVRIKGQERDAQRAKDAKQAEKDANDRAVSYPTNTKGRRRYQQILHDADIADNTSVADGDYGTTDVEAIATSCYMSAGKKSNRRDETALLKQLSAEVMRLSQHLERVVQVVHRKPVRNKAKATTGTTLPGTLLPAEPADKSSNERSANEDRMVTEGKSAYTDEIRSVARNAASIAVGVTRQKAYNVVALQAPHIDRVLPIARSQNQQQHLHHGQPLLPPALALAPPQQHQCKIPISTNAYSNRKHQIDQHGTVSQNDRMYDMYSTPGMVIDKRSILANGYSTIKPRVDTGLHEIRVRMQKKTAAIPIGRMPHKQKKKIKIARQKYKFFF